MSQSASWWERIHSPIDRLGVAEWLMVAVTALGLALRVEHALTFDGPLRGADYAVNLDGVQWIFTHLRPFDFTEQVSIQVRYQPPLWWALGAVIVHSTGSERAIAALAVVGWLLRQGLLWAMLKQAIPKHRWAMLLALSINAILPISVLTDGKVNPEGLHSTLFTVALYTLWRMERELGRLQGISLKTAMAFGGFSGLAVLSKATAAVLVLAAAIAFLWWALRFRKAGGWGLARRQLLGPAVGAGVAWCLVAGWWCGPNLWKYGHPFPHYWNSASKIPGNRYYLEAPVLDRRPMSWLLPFEWSEYLEHPVIHNDVDPRPNFWAAVVTGTWTDFYNRGFCRLQGGGSSTRVWGASWAPPYGGPDWYLSNRCLDLFRRLLRVGLGLTVVSVLAMLHTAWNYLRTKGRSGSLVLPTNIVLVVFFVMFFAFVFPFDDNAVLNPRYLLPIAAPMCACLALALAQNTLGKPARWLLHALLFAATAVVGALLMFERFGS